MKADVPYNDFIGTSAADISDVLGVTGGNYLKTIGKYFNLDENRFKIVALSISGRKEFGISLICVDKQRSIESKEHIVKIICNTRAEKDILSILFKSLNIVFYDRFDTKYVNKDYDEEASFSDFHESEE